MFWFAIAVIVVLPVAGLQQMSGVILYAVIGFVPLTLLGALAGLVDVALRWYLAVQRTRGRKAGLWAAVGVIFVVATAAATLPQLLLGASFGPLHAVQGGVIGLVVAACLTPVYRRILGPRECPARPRPSGEGRQ